MEGPPWRGIGQALYRFSLGQLDDQHQIGTLHAGDLKDTHAANLEPVADGCGTRDAQSSGLERKYNAIVGHQLRRLWEKGRGRERQSPQRQVGLAGS